MVHLARVTVGGDVGDRAWFDTTEFGLGQVGPYPQGFQRGESDSRCLRRGEIADFDDAFTHYTIEGCIQIGILKRFRHFHYRGLAGIYMRSCSAAPGFGFVGIGIAFWLHYVGRKTAATSKADALLPAMGPVARWAQRKWYVDELYDFVLVKPLWVLGHVFYLLDRLLVDGLVNLAG